MKRIFAITLLVLVLAVTGAAQQQVQSPIAAVPDQQLQTRQWTFNGAWMPSIDPALIGAENYRTLQNLRYTSNGGLEAIGGYTDINTTALGSTIDAGFHFKKDNPAETHVLVSSGDSIYENETAIPSAGDFTATALHTDASGAGDPRFSKAPYGNVAYANGKELMIWGGDEIPVAAFITSTAAVTTAPTNGKDYTTQVNSAMSTADQVAVIGGGNDSTDTLMLLHLDGADAGTTFTDSSSNTLTVTAGGDTNTDTDQAKFGVSSAYFDGTGDYLTSTDDDGVSDYWFMDTGKYAVDFWIRFSSVAADVHLVGQRTDADNYVALWWDQSETKLKFQIQETGGALELDLQATLDPSVDTWYHLAFERGATNCTVYVGGVIGATATAVDWPDLTGALYIGINSDGSSDPLSGWIDEFRWTSGVAVWDGAFTPPARPYSASARYFLVGSPRPLQGVKLYIADGNTQTSALTCKEWNGRSWNSLTITDNTDTGASLAATGTVTWTSTGEAAVKYIDSRLLYWYQFALSAGDATIYRVTLDAPWQDLVDLWDGVFRQVVQFQAYKSAKYEDYTLEVNESGDNTYTYYGDLGGMTAAEHLIVMFEERMTGVKFTMIAGKENTTDATVTVYYWNGEDWKSVGTVADTTLDDATGAKSLGQSGMISWTPPEIEQEFLKTQFGTTGYAYKFVWSATLTASNAQVNLATGVPAQIEIRPFKFPAIYKDRLFLCGYTEGSEGNRCDYSMAHAPQVFNGEETSMDGLQSLYFGGEEELVAGTQLYNRMGSNIFIFFLALKANETYVLTGDGPDDFQIFPVSMNVGCPAPYSLATAEMGFEIAQDVERHVAIWLSYSGPVMFDGAVIYQIPGLEIYFDPTLSTYVGQTYIDDAVGWFDQTHREYNLRVADYWFVYSLRLKRWYEKDTGTAAMPESAWTVNDTSGNQYVFAGLAAGQMVRLENGTSWDGTAITQKVQTGDFWPTDNIWDLTRIRRVKLAARRIADAHTLKMTHYSDSDTMADSDWTWDDESTTWEDSDVWTWDSGTPAVSIDLSGAGTTGSDSRLVRATKPMNAIAWTHGFGFEVTTSSSAKAFQPVAWGIEYLLERKDH